MTSRGRRIQSQWAFHDETSQTSHKWVWNYSDDDDTERPSNTNPDVVWQNGRPIGIYRTWTYPDGNTTRHYTEFDYDDDNDN